MVGNFSQMQLSYSETSSGKTTGYTTSFVVAHYPHVEGTFTTELNITLSSQSSGTTTNSSALAYVADNGTVVLLTASSQNFTGATAQALADTYLGALPYYLTVAASFPTTYATIYGGLSAGAPATTTYGELTMTVTTYSGTATYGGFSGSISITAGQVESDGRYFKMLTNFTESGTESGGSYSLVIKLVSATQS